MDSKHKKIISLLESYLERNPDQRFGQALLNLGINQFKNENPERKDFSIRDIYNDSDQAIIGRIESQLAWFDLQETVSNALSGSLELKGMTVNEKLYMTGLMNEFDKHKIHNKEFARFILKSLSVDADSISLILM
ncbi:hypothetical protein HUK80_01995 [Flavobacterium sp. MAH-1]|uniref:Uncharacterized protein n=1 Tax=Flavobacterium agri TaxID=2743471 RepID=A0A7Y9C5Y3_9FLAO|nr:hypothetical protein [Flavobacterium agri]NUY79652.1 hypothetical protein [Flavobacterium agri]NYA69677.1 hypothetical protein [Flavobacterium agri]